MSAQRLALLLAALTSCGDGVVDHRYIGTPLQVLQLPDVDYATQQQLILWWNERFEVAAVSQLEPVHGTEWKSFALYEPPPAQAVLPAQRWTAQQGAAAFGVWVSIKWSNADPRGVVLLNGVVQPPFELASANETLMFIPEGSTAAGTSGYHLNTGVCPYRPIKLPSVYAVPSPVVASQLDGGSVLEILPRGCR